VTPDWRTLEWEIMGPDLLDGDVCPPAAFWRARVPGGWLVAMVVYNEVQRARASICGPDYDPAGGALTFVPELTP